MPCRPPPPAPPRGPLRSSIENHAPPRSTMPGITARIAETARRLDAHHPRPERVIHLGNRGERIQHTGIVDQDVHARSVEHALHSLLAGNIGNHRLGADLLGHFSYARLVDVDQYNLGAAGSKPSCDGATNPAGRTRDDGHPTIEALTLRTSKAVHPKSSSWHRMVIPRPSRWAWRRWPVRVERPEAFDPM